MFAILLSLSLLWFQLCASSIILAVPPHSCGFFSGFFLHSHILTFANECMIRIYSAVSLTYTHWSLCTLCEQHPNVHKHVEFCIGFGCDFEWFSFFSFVLHSIEIQQKNSFNSTMCPCPCLSELEFWDESLVVLIIEIIAQKCQRCQPTFHR